MSFIELDAKHRRLSTGDWQQPLRPQNPKESPNSDADTNAPHTFDGGTTLLQEVRDWLTSNDPDKKATIAARNLAEKADYVRKATDALNDFYARHNPDKLRNVDHIVQHYLVPDANTGKNNEEALTV